MISSNSAKTQVYTNQDVGNEIQTIESEAQILSDVVVKRIFQIGY